jgi:aspartyl/glutamyl-tRNA(Asn/Gln) amidotransferase C subunit
MISKEEVGHIAKLARLELTEKETEKIQKDLSAILDYFNLLKKAPKPKESVKIAGDLSATRKDEAKPRDAGLAEKLIAAAPNKKDDYIKVKAIL